jgi:hypothetical protein
MTTLEQHIRVVRRKLIDRIRSTGVCTGGVQGYEAGKAPTERSKIYGIVVPNDGFVTGTSLTGAHVWQAMTIHFMKAVPLDGDRPSETESEQIDPALTDARDTALAALMAPIGYGDAVELDPAGHSGERVRWSTGYLDWDQTKFRTATITAGFVAWNALETTR